MSKLLTVGFSTYDDYHGAYFTLQSLKIHHPEAMKDVDIVVVDNNPDSIHGTHLRKLGEDWMGFKYVPVKSKVGTSVRNTLFDQSNSEYTLCLDSHVLLWSKALFRLTQYLRKESPDALLHGPLMFDDQRTIRTHMTPDWSDNMWGVWARDMRGINENAEPFEIPMNGMGLFCAKTSEWLRFNDHFQGFGGEEGYIHQKYYNEGRGVLCLPFLRWTHRFDRPEGTKYPNLIEDRVFNYFLGFRELGMDVSPIYEHFKRFNPKKLSGIDEKARKILGIPNMPKKVSKDLEIVGGRGVVAPKKPKIEVIPKETLATTPAVAFEASDISELLEEGLSGPEGKKPNMIIFGVGHSGTTVTTRMIHELGWGKGDADAAFAESVSCRKINMAIRSGSKVSPDKIGEALDKNPEPFAIKDPRFVLTLPHWKQYFDTYRTDSYPSLLWLYRDYSDVERSYLKRGYVNRQGEATLYGKTLQELFDLAEENFSKWEGPKLQIKFSDLDKASSLFDSGKANR